MIPEESIDSKESEYANYNYVLCIHVLRASGLCNNLCNILWLVGFTSLPIIAANKKCRHKSKTYSTHQTDKLKGILSHKFPVHVHMQFS